MDPRLGDGPLLVARAAVFVLRRFLEVASEDALVTMPQTLVDAMELLKVRRFGGVKCLFSR